MIIYKATNKFNGHSYVGLTTSALKERIRGHRKCMKKPRGHFHLALVKYGLENFTWEMIGSANTLEELNQLEINLISQLKPEYNMTSGGGGVRGQTPWNKGKTLPNELKERISNTLKGYKVPDEVKKKISETMKGRKYSDERRKAVSEGSKGKKMSSESRAKMSASKMGNKNGRSMNEVKGDVELV